ncbi:phage head closure protein [Phaeobacter sp. PT47_59]|uniref:phage head closure protein n=1 Tax=Phaeobacter sp. PT47_59 TaxID=3029979 RepID=UPI0023809E91|nr:phage head closure protein [Phaeobacter sp. PT47_59]MDE4173668.1 phage head closure protein [Phaeobacter sp. PT47_59]
MIRAGKLDRQITIERKGETVAASGAVMSEWLPVATIRAELVQRSADEYLAGFGEADAGGAVFRIRYLAGITTADRVTCDGEAYDIDEIAELGRKRGLELRCSEVAA